MQRQVQVQQTTGLHLEPRRDEFEGDGLWKMGELYGFYSPNVGMLWAEATPIVGPPHVRFSKSLGQLILDQQHPFSIRIWSEDCPLHAENEGVFRVDEGQLASFRVTHESPWGSEKNRKTNGFCNLSCKVTVEERWKNTFIDLIILDFAFRHLFLGLLLNKPMQDITPFSSWQNPSPVTSRDLEIATSGTSNMAVACGLSHGWFCLIWFDDFPTKTGDAEVVLEWENHRTKRKSIPGKILNYSNGAWLSCKQCAWLTQDILVKVSKHVPGGTSTNSRFCQVNPNFSLCKLFGPSNDNQTPSQKSNGPQPRAQRAEAPAVANWAPARMA